MKFTQAMLDPGTTAAIDAETTNLAETMLTLIENAKPLPPCILIGALEAVKFLVLQEIKDQVDAANAAPAPVPTPAPAPQQ